MDYDFQTSINNSSSDVTSQSNAILPIEGCSSNNKDTYLSIILYDSHVGVSYYDTDSAIVHLLLDIIDLNPFHQTQHLLEEVRPSVIISSARQDDGFLSVLHKYAASLTNSDSYDSEYGYSSEVATDQYYETSSPRCVVEVLSSIEFSYESGKRRLLSVHLPDIPCHYTEIERMMYLSTIIPFDNESTIRTAGALIRYLEKHYTCARMASNVVKIPISRFEIFTLKDVVLVDKSSYCALQLFHRVSHPSAYKATSREGMSLFGILNYTSTFLGQRLLRSWFCRPICDPKLLNKRLDSVSYFVNPKNDEIAKTLRECLKHIKNIPRITALMKTSKLTVADWLRLLQTAQSAIKIVEVCRSVATSSSHEYMPPLFNDILKWSDQELSGIVAMIANTMDIDASKHENHFVVLPGVSKVIDDVKEAYAKLPSVLAKIAQQEMRNYHSYISVCQIVYMRRIGYLLFTPKSDAMKQLNQFEIPGMELVAASDETVYYKTTETRKLDEEFGDILEELAFQELEVSTQLQDKLILHSSVFLDVMQYTAELDCLLAFAYAAKEFNYVRPKLTENRELHIIGSRHPLQEQLTSLFVPNNINFGTEDGFIKVITGPNTSGKSTYLKQIGVIVFMAHIGCFVPADSAIIGVISRIYTVIRNPESLSSGLSSFSHDLVRLSCATTNSNDHSLVLIDEFGKGTATVDGISLLSSCLTYMLEKNCATPMIVCATHFHSLVQQSLLPPSPIIRFYVMDSINSRPLETICLYQLIEGVSGRSYASHVAKTAGVPTEIVRRSLEVTEIIRTNAPVRQFSKASTITYQNHCNDVVDQALVCNLEETLAKQQLLRNIEYTMNEAKSSKSSKAV